MDGVLRILRDVVVKRLKNGDIVATGSEPGLVGEIVTLHLVGGGDVRARVADSRPVLVDGFVRHRLRLVVAKDVPAVDDESERGVAEAK